MGNYRYTVLGQGICSSQDLFNYVTDGKTKRDEDFDVLKNIDNFCVYSETLAGLEKQIEKLVRLCKRVNLNYLLPNFPYQTLLNLVGQLLARK